MTADGWVTFGAPLEQMPWKNVGGDDAEELAQAAADLNPDRSKGTMNGQVNLGLNRADMPTRLSARRKSLQRRLGDPAG